MGRVSCCSACCVCGEPFFYNPLRVPSIPIDGVREPICQSCVDMVNPQRVANGLAPIVPHPDAYGSCDEHELPPLDD